MTKFPTGTLGRCSLTFLRFIISAVIQTGIRNSKQLVQATMRGLFGCVQVRFLLAQLLAQCEYARKVQVIFRSVELVGG